MKYIHPFMCKIRDHFIKGKCFSHHDRIPILEQEFSKFDLDHTTSAWGLLTLHAGSLSRIGISMI